MEPLSTCPHHIAFLRLPTAPLPRPPIHTFPLSPTHRAVCPMLNFAFARMLPFTLVHPPTALGSNAPILCLCFALLKCTDAVKALHSSQMRLCSRQMQPCSLQMHRTSHQMHLYSYQSHPCTCVKPHLYLCKMHLYLCDTAPMFAPNAPMLVQQRHL